MLGAALFAVLLGVVSLAVAPSAAAASCAATIHIQGPVGITLQPASVTVDRGSCVTIRNDLAGRTVHVTVAPGFAKDVPAGGSVAYPAGVSGKHALHVSYVLSDASGVITVRSPAPAPSHSPSPVSSPAAQPPSSSGTGPQVAPSAPTPSPGRSLPGSVVGAGRPPTPRNPSVAQPPVPVTVPPPARPAVVAGPIEAASARGAGLPAAIAALALVGTAAALVRVLLVATDGPVDTRRNVVAGP
jgi:hypothetical protein